MTNEDGVIVIASADEIAALRARVEWLEKAFATMWPLVQAQYPKATALAARLLGERQ